MSELTEAVTDTVADFNYIVFGLIMLVYLSLNTQIFYEKVLSKFDGAIHVGIPSNYGTMIQALIMGLLAILIFSLYEHEII